MVKYCANDDKKAKIKALNKKNYQKRLESGKVQKYYQKAKASGKVQENYQKLLASGKVQEYRQKLLASGKTQEYNDKHNPKHNVKKRNELRLAYEEFHRENGQIVQTEEQRMITLDNIMELKRPELDNKSLKDCVKNPDFSFYVGGTFRKLQDEDLRWLTARGGAKFDENCAVIPGTQDRKNRPVLLRVNGRGITMNEAREEFGFRSVFVYKDLLHANTSYIEDQLQRRYQNLDLGRRLWRCNGKGPNFSQKKEVHKVFITYSFKAMNAVNTGKLRIVH